MSTDTTAPTVQFSDNRSDTLNRSTPTIVYTLNFSEAVTGLELGDFTVNYGAVTAVTGSGQTWAVTVTAFDGAMGALQITLKADAVSDAAGNKNLAASDSRQALDTQFPQAPLLTARGIATPLLDARVRFDTTLGSYTLELDPDLAPLSVANMLSYVGKGYYANTLFHRIVNQPGPDPAMQIVQGGGLTTGLVPKTTDGAILLESDNGLSNVRGSVAMARTSSPDSATSQFYINVQDNLFLDYQSQLNPGYAVFGRVVAGMDVIDAMAVQPVGTSGNFQNVPVTEIRITQASLVQTPSVAYSRSGVLDVGRLEAGSRWIYSFDGGSNAYSSTGSTLTLPVGRYEIGDVLVQQIDANGNSSRVSMYGRTLVVDATAPLVQQFNPADGTSGLSSSLKLVLSFSEAILAGSGQFLLKTAAGQTVASYAAGDAALRIDGQTLTLTPARPVAPGTSYRLEWTAGAVTDLAGNPVAAQTSYDFSTAAATGPRFWKNAALTPADVKMRDAVDLQDAIAVLKMIVGLPVNGDGSALAPTQALAADFDQNQKVELKDAIDMLKLIVGLPTSAQPGWKYYDATTLPASVDAAQAQDSTAWAPSALPVSAASPTLELVGVLTGDVNGSWTP